MTPVQAPNWIPYLLLQSANYCRLKKGRSFCRRCKVDPRACCLRCAATSPGARWRCRTSASFLHPTEWGIIAFYRGCKGLLFLSILSLVLRCLRQELPLIKCCKDIHGTLTNKILIHFKSFLNYLFLVRTLNSMKRCPIFRSLRLLRVSGVVWGFLEYLNHSVMFSKDLSLCGELSINTNLDIILLFFREVRSLSELCLGCGCNVHVAWFRGVQRPGAGRIKEELRKKKLPIMFYFQSCKSPARMWSWP